MSNHKLQALLEWILSKIHNLGWGREFNFVGLNDISIGKNCYNA
jgi:hypothetical protein